MRDKGRARTASRRGPLDGFRSSSSPPPNLAVRLRLVELYLYAPLLRHDRQTRLAPLLGIPSPATYPYRVALSISSRSHETKDLDLEEKGGFEAEAPLEVSSQDDGIKREGSTGVIGWLWKVSKKLDSYGVEVRGVERVPEDERHHACVPGTIFRLQSHANPM